MDTEKINWHMYMDLAKMMHWISNATAKAIKNLSTDELNSLYQAIYEINKTSTDANNRVINSIRHIVKALLTGQEIVVRPPKFRIWKTIKLGTFKNEQDLFQTIKNAHNSQEKVVEFDKICDGRVSSFLQSQKFKVNQTKTKLNLALVTVAELNFGCRKVSGCDVYKRALEFGFKLCPAEVGPQLFLQPPELSEDENTDLYIAMEPVEIDKNYSGNQIFNISSCRGYVERGKYIRSRLLLLVDTLPHLLDATSKIGFVFVV